MKESIRRLVLFVVIVGTGSVLIFVDVPLIYLIPLVAAVGFVLLLLLGSITVAEIKGAFSGLSRKKPDREPAKASGKAKVSIREKFKSLKIAGKKPAEKPAETKRAEEKKTASGSQSLERSGGIRAHLSLLAASFKSFGKIVSDRKKPVKKIEDIDRLLEHTIKEKVSRGSALESAATVPAAAVPGAGGAGSSPDMEGSEADPFLSLSGEELETGLLDTLDEPEPGAPAADLPGAAGSFEAVPDISLSDLEMPALPDDTAADAEAFLAANAEDGMEELHPLEGAEAVDETLGDLDHINLDDIDLGDDSGDAEPVPAAAPPASPPTPSESGGLIPATPIVPGASDADGKTQKDMSSIASGPALNADDDMLSSLASDIKQVKKEENVSLLRELKDFKAPAAEIEKELQEVSAHLNAIGKDSKKRATSHEGGIK